jgi:hypothetical protein
MLSAHIILCSSSNTKCPLLLKNTSGSSIWISQDPMVGETLTADQLEQSKAQEIRPYETGHIQLGTTFTIHTRTPQSNNTYQRNFTVVQRLCDPDSDEYIVDFALLTAGHVDPARFIVINHAKQNDIPESSYPLCPGGLKAEFDEETDQWFCKVYRYSDVYEKLVDEYVPVLSYIYQWLPSNIWTQWYIKNPQFYHWYHRNPELYNHLEHYVAPWQTKEYALWYNAQPQKIKNNAHEPESVQTFHHATSAQQNPLGFPESRVKTKASQIKNVSVSEPHKKIAPPIVIHAKEVKKQELEDIISSDDYTLQEPTASKEKELHISQNVQPLHKPMAISKRCVIKTQSGSQPVAL